MKEQYEWRSRMLLPRRTYTIIRLDGKAFHSYCRFLERPFDMELVEDMGNTLMFLCKAIDGVVFGFQQSDEISLLLTDFATIHTGAWFDGNVQKIVSVTASMCTDEFNSLRTDREDVDPTIRGYFDARVFTIPDPTEVANYFIWRQKDATRNSISMAAQAHFSPNQLYKKTSNETQEMLFQEVGINWNDFPVSVKRGQLCARITSEEDVTYAEKETGKLVTVEGVKRSSWELMETPIFTQTTWLQDSIPRVE